MMIKEEIYIEKDRVLRDSNYANFLQRGLVGTFYGKNLKSNSINMKFFYKNKIKVAIDFNNWENDKLGAPHKVHFQFRTAFPI